MTVFRQRLCIPISDETDVFIVLDIQWWLVGAVGWGATLNIIAVAISITNYLNIRKYTS